MYFFLVSTSNLKDEYPQVRFLRKRVLVSKLFEDLKARERRNKTDMGTTRRGLNRTQELQQSIYIRLDEGLTSLSGKVSFVLDK